MPQVNVNGAALEYPEEGNGEPLVFVHGSASDYRTWHLQKDALAGRFRVITFSRRYHWPNEPIPDGADYAMAEHIAHLRALLHALDAAPAYLVGHSYGAFVCLLLAQQDPHLVQTLVPGRTAGHHAVCEQQAETSGAPETVSDPAPHGGGYR